MEAICDKCLWSGQCFSYQQCEYYTPGYEDVDAIIENGRYEYYREWGEYINEVDE